MKLHSDPSDSGHACQSRPRAIQDMNLNHRLTLTSCTPNSGCLDATEPLCNGLSNQSERENSETHCDESEAEEDLAPEVQQAHRIFQSFLSEKHKSTTAPFWRPIGPDAHMSFRTMDDKFVKREYESITAFVADFRLMLENCYRFHGVNHWISKQAQKLEIILEQKLTLLPRPLRERTALWVTSRGRFGSEQQKTAVCSSSRRRRCRVSVCSSESIMVQALRLEELQRTREHRRQREQERKEAEEASVKDLEDWETSLLSLAEPHPVSSMWELPAIGHFLCLAQRALNLPEIVFYELERCLLMPRCSVFLARLMTSLLCPPLRRSSVHRRPPMPYRRWESELRRRVQAWYCAVGRDDERAAEQLGLCRTFFWTLGSVNPLEETPFHLLSFKKRVWLLKGLCDHVYETQKDVQDAVLGQPIHECRESILGYDEQENAYIHFPHFCGADLRIYRQSPCGAVELPLPDISVRRTAQEHSDGLKMENESSWDIKEDSFSDGEDLDQKTSSILVSWCPEDSQCSSERFKEEKEEDEDECEPCFRVGENCYKGISPALNSHRTPDKDWDCSGALQEFPHHFQPENTRLRKHESTENTLKKKKRRKRTEGRMKKSRTSKLSLKRRTARMSVQRAAHSLRRRRRHVPPAAVKQTEMKATAEREAGPALLTTEPTFQLVCSSLDDLRVLISKTEDQLDNLDGKKRSCRWPHNRAAVKDLHITLIRLLNELLPWEPKLLKAFHRNRARLKKECDDFKKHPEYENFIREQTDAVHSGEVTGKDASVSTEATRELEDEDRISRNMKEYSEEAENVNQLGNHVSRCLVDTPELLMHSSESGPFTRGSKRRQSAAITDETSPSKKGKIETESSLSSEYNVEVVSREQATDSLLPEPVSSFQRTCKPIQALLAKSVGNKVTLISHPKAAVMAQISRDHRTASVAVPPVVLTTCLPTPHAKETLAPTTTESTGQVVYKAASGVGLLSKASTFSVQQISDQKTGEKLMQKVVILPSNLLIQSTEKKAVQTSTSVSKNTPYLSNASGFTIPENKIPVQQVAPLKDTSTVRTPSAVVTPSLRTVSVPKKTTEPKVVGSSGLTKPDAKEELRTVCIRDSQSILVTTRGGNTGVVKVQTSGSGTGVLPPSPVFTISPQLQAFLVSKSSTLQAVSATPAAKSVSGVTPQSLSKDGAHPSSSTFVTGTDTSLTLNNTSTKRSVNISSSLATGRISDSVIIPTKNAQGVQNVVSKCGMKTPQKSTLPESRTPAQTTFQKVFLVNPSPSGASISSNNNMYTTTTTCTKPAPQVMFISNAALTIPKGVATSEVNISSVSTPAMKIIPKLGTTLSSTSSDTNVVNVGVPGLTSRILDPNRTPEASTKSTPVVVSRVSSASASSGLQIVSKSSLVAGTSGNTERSLKEPETAESKMLTFSTLGTGHMASSALLSVVKQDVASSVSTLNAFHSKPVLTSGSSTSSNSGSLITKHTKVPIDVTTKPVIASLCTSHSPVKTIANSCASGVSHPFAISPNSPSTLPIVMTSGIRPPTTTNKSVHERVVINTTAPLAPGTQLLINNTRFVVPSQGLGPGTHVLLISSGSGGLQASSTVHPKGLQITSPVRSAGLQVQSLAHPEGLQVLSSAHPRGLQVPSTVRPKGLQVTSMAPSVGLQAPSSAHPAVLQVTSPAHPKGLQVPSPVHPAGLQVSSPAPPAGLHVPSPVGLQVSAGLHVPSPAPPPVFQVTSPACPKGLQVPSPVHSAGLQPPSPTHSVGLQVPSPVCPAGLQVSSPVHLAGLQVSSSVHPGGLRAPGELHFPSSASTVLKGPKSLVPYTVASVVQGVRLVTPVRLPSPITGPSTRVHQQLNTITPPKVAGPTALSQAALALHPGASSDIVRLPIFQASKVSVAPSQGATGIPKDTLFSQGGLLSTTSPMHLQGKLSQNQLPSVIPSTKTTIVRNSPMVNVPPMKSTVSRMQKLPVATVQPIGGPINTSSATPIATVPPSMNTVIMTPCPPIRAVQPGTVGKPVILPQLQQGQHTVPIQVPTSSKLLLSPDGAVLNIIQASSVQVMAKPTTGQVVSSTSSSVTNFTHE
ncbi:uncharacterized protein KIAA2026-like [Danio aesculapii]|uniref:uncharacterized protein KIAA2026-like n=1 Tax=Danio aesculapii TaxID=1142201 RepID=UPI0024C00F59|nr:uncharacterized protein KIAA2026-like [Danio aesculapii]